MFFHRRSNPNKNWPEKTCRDHRKTNEKVHLKQIISFTRGPSAWEELLQTEGDIRKKRQKAIYDQEERRRQFLEVVAVIGLVLAIGGFVVFLGYLYLLKS